MYKINKSDVKPLEDCCTDAVWMHRLRDKWPFSGEMALWARGGPWWQKRSLNATQKCHKSSRNGVHSYTNTAWGIIRALHWIYRGKGHSPCPGGATKRKINMQILIITYRVMSQGRNPMPWSTEHPILSGESNKIRRGIWLLKWVWKDE